MNEVKGLYESSLKPDKLLFSAAAGLLLIVLTSFTIQAKNRIFLEKTVTELTSASSGLSRLKTATANRKQVLAALKNKFDQNISTSSPEMVLYKKFDYLQAALKPDGINVTNVEKKGGEASISFTLTFNNPDFNALLNTVTDLHGSIFPMTPVSAISVTQNELKNGGGITYKITGKIITDNNTVKP